jgi:arylsulfatase A-like enzyme
MMFKQFSNVIAFIFVGWLVSLAGADQPSMNVLFIISDDLRTELGCYGSPIAKTPNIDALAAKSVQFERAYCQFPLCNPSRSSMLTGRYPTTTGVFGNRTWFGAEHPEFVSLPKYFRQHGYVTLATGKIFHGGIDEVEAWTAGGRERIFGAGAPRRDSPESRKSLGLAPAAGFTKTAHNDRWVVLEGDGESHGDYHVADQTIEYLRKHRDRPFFLGCGFEKPHSPLEAPQRFFDLWETKDIRLPPDFAPQPTIPAGFPAGAIRPQNADLFVGREASPDEAREMIRAYLASTAWMDWNVGRVLAELDALGLRETTIVVFWGDHGYQLGEKGKWSKAGSLWEQGIRVPLMICDPRVKGHGTVCRRLVESIDIYPTLCELCGLPPPPGVEGHSLAPLVDEPTRLWDHPAYSVWSEDGEHVTGVSVRTEDWHYAEFFGRGAGAMLIDPEGDPHELKNLAERTEHAEVVARLSALARAHVAGHTPE